MYKYSDIKSTIIRTPEQLIAALEFIQANEILGFDLESDGVNPRKNKTAGIGIANNKEGFYLPIYEYNPVTKEFTTITDEHITRTFLTALNGKKLLAWNGAFEAKFCAIDLAWDFIDNFYSDQMLMLHLIDENKYNYGLKENAQADFGDDAIHAQQLMLASMRENGGTGYEYCKASVDSLGHYCVWDCVLTVWYYERDIKALREQGLEDFFFKDEVMPLYKYVTIPMESTGVHLDLPLLTKAKLEIETDIQKLEAAILTQLEPHTSLFETWYLNKEHPPLITGPFIQALGEVLNVQLPKLESGRYSLAAKHIDTLSDGLLFKKFFKGEAMLDPVLTKKVQLKVNGGQPKVNLNSKHHLKKIFFDTLKCEPLSRTPTGLPQVDDNFLESIKGRFDFVPLLQDYNKLIKINGTYITRFLDEHESGIWYPQFNLHRTVSGRMGSDAQQLPRRLEDGAASPVVLKYNNMIRDFIIAAPEHVLVGADYESLEPKVFSHASGDEKLKDIFRKGHDFYSTIAIDTEGLQNVSADKKAANYLGKVNKGARQRAKPYALGIPYGLTGYKLQFEIEVDQKTADGLVANYLDAYPKLAQFMESSKWEAKTKGYVRSEAGRIRHLARAKELYDKHGDMLLDSLALWKEYHSEPGKYNHMKKLRREYSNLLNNSINFKIQGLASSIINRACIAVMKEFKEQNINAKIVLVVHDECVIHCKLDDSEKVCYLMKEALEQTYKITVPLVADPVVATVYGETK